ncbi:MAG: hypothetical protein HYZ51_05040 [Candidatus Doudnabacteria bacterium]|nr:hypothetical protein [Candidatus Doudnabacteria bacterium]
MSKISFTFEDLCAFFTKHQSRLMVGMISTDNEPAQDVHCPHIVIKENGVIRREYHGFSEISGDISLDVHPTSTPLVHYTPKSSQDKRQSFDSVIDFEDQLYPANSFKANPKRCRARLHFSSGELYTCAHAINAVFADSKTYTPHTKVQSIGTKAGLDVQIPKDGYAVLHFNNDTEDFVFKGGRSYQVEVINRAEAVDFNHFRYFYNIVTPKPKQRLIPISAQGVGANVMMGDWVCLIGAFSKSDYELP